MAPNNDAKPINKEMDQQSIINNTDIISNLTTYNATKCGVLSQNSWSNSNF